LFSHYTFASSTLEFWLISLLRSFLLFASILAVLFNPHDACRRLRTVSPAFLLSAAAVGIFTIIKLLFRADLSREVLSLDVWFWVQFSWSLLATAGFYGCLLVLMNVKLVVGINKEAGVKRGVVRREERGETINSSSGEHQRLINDEPNDEPIDELLNNSKL